MNAFGVALALVMIGWAILFDRANAVPLVAMASILFFHATKRAV